MKRASLAIPVRGSRARTVRSVLKSVRSLDTAEEELLTFLRELHDFMATERITPTLPLQTKELRASRRQELSVRDEGVVLPEDYNRHLVMPVWRSHGFPHSYDEWLELIARGEADQDLANTFAQELDYTVYTKAIRDALAVYERVPLRGRLRQRKASPEPRPRIQTKDCLNDTDYFTLEEWNDLPSGDVIRIWFPGQAQPQCYDRRSLRLLFAQPESERADWVAKPGETLDEMGFGGTAGKQRFYKVPPQFWIDADARDLIEGTLNNFQAKVKLRAQRVGNVRGDFAGPHGEEAMAITVYSLEPKRKPARKKS